MYAPSWLHLPPPIALRRVLRRPTVGLVVQTLLTGISIVIVFLVLGSLEGAVIAASLGSTAYIVFMVPHSRLATPRAILGGHLLALPAGLAAGVLLDASPTTRVLAMGGAVVAVSLLMEVSSTSHPPAAGTALGLALFPGAIPLLSIVVGAVVLAAMHRLLARRLLDVHELRRRLQESRQDSPG